MRQDALCSRYVGNGLYFTAIIIILAASHCLHVHPIFNDGR